MKFACTFVLADMITSQDSAVPEHAPDQPVKFTPGAGVAVSVTVVPWPYLAEQLLPQLIWVDSAPAGFPVIVPEPLRPTDRVNTGVKVAVTFS